MDVEGNPNYVETISGTINNPWGSVNKAELFADMEAGDATVYITLPSFGYTIYLISYSDDGVVCGGSSGANWLFNSNLNYAVYVVYNTSSGANIFAKKYSSNGTASNITSSTATVLTIIHHPMPTA